MKFILRLEQACLVLLSIYLFAGLGYAWWWYPALLLAPDLSAIGYLAGPRAGAFVYNFFHHQGLAALLYIAGAGLGLPALALAGVIILGHSSLDRVLGFGLKYADAFEHTHLGMIGKSARAAIPEQE